MRVCVPVFRHNFLAISFFISYNYTSHLFPDHCPSILCFHLIRSESYPPTLTNTSLPQFSDLHSQMKSLKSLFDATQDNSRRQMSGLRTEVARVSSAMEEMKMKYQLLLEEVCMCVCAYVYVHTLSM